MSDLLSPGLGTTIGISSTLPADELAATYGALTYTEIGHVESVPEFGANFDVVTFVPLKTGTTAKYHGANNPGSLTVPMGLDPTDAGQTALKAALDAKARVAFQITYPDGSIDYVQGKIFSRTKSADVGSVRMANMQIEFETDIVEVAAP